MHQLTPTCVWTISDELVVALDANLGEPVDTYVNGSQVWFRDPTDEITLQLRLHPVAGFRRPPGVEVHDLFSDVALAVAEGREPPAAPAALWDGLEAYPAFGEEVDVDVLAAWATDIVGIGPTASGVVDHGPIGEEWERSEGQTSIISALLAQLS